ncbi:MAG: phytanoyl-CoA dioxygenase family protein [Gemmatimonadetes bacterium]|nr:phytanoyl-CoA dioxygenase family protein [Gemmatimonadota bacterium]
MPPTHLDPSAVAHYNERGYVILHQVFAEDEISAMIEAAESGSRVADTTRSRQDGEGRPTRLAIWHDLGNDVWTAASTSPRIVNNIRILLGEEAAFFHGKVIFKDAHEGGAWEWHQDYGYWYNQGFAFPRMISAFVVLDPATEANGCLQVLAGSHHLGRLDHGRVGDQTGTEASRVDQVVPLFERVPCEMDPGDVLFFHCNLLHTSEANLSDHPRRSFIICFNALSNPQFATKQTAESRPCPVSADNAILTAANEFA